MTILGRCLGLLALAGTLLPAAAIAAAAQVTVAPEDGGEELRALLSEELPEALVSPGQAAELTVRLRELDGRTELIIEQQGALRLRRDIGVARSLAALRVAVVLVRQTLLRIASEPGLALPLPPVEAVKAATIAAPAVTDTTTRAVVRPGLEIIEPEAEPEPSLEAEAPVVAPPQASEVPVRYRVILGAAASWWSAPALAPNLGLTLGFERRGDTWWLGGELRFAGIPCCVRTVGLIEATSVEVSALGVALLPLARVGPVTFGLLGGAGIEVVAVDATILVPSSARSPIETIPSAAASFRLAAAAELAMDPTVRISVGARLGLPSLRVTAPPTLVSDPLDTGWVTPYVALGFPAEVF